MGQLAPTCVAITPRGVVGSRGGAEAVESPTGPTPASWAVWQNPTRSD
jgi:hypothetical protein